VQKNQEVKRVHLFTSFCNILSWARYDPINLLGSLYSWHFVQVVFAWAGVIRHICGLWQSMHFRCIVLICKACLPTPGSTLWHARQSLISGLTFAWGLWHT